MNIFPKLIRLCGEKHKFSKIPEEVIKIRFYTKIQPGRNGFRSTSEAPECGLGRGCVNLSSDSSDCYGTSFGESMLFLCFGCILAISANYCLKNSFPYKGTCIETCLMTDSPANWSLQWSLYEQKNEFNLSF